MVKNNKMFVLVSTSLAVLLATLNSGTLIIALPELMRELNASMVSILWVLLIYNLTTSVLLLNVGRLSDVIGRKKIYILGLAIFTVSSLLCGLASNVVLLILFRGLQGIGSCLMFGVSTALITDAFAINERGMALGINSMVAAVGQMAGPIIGGFLVTFGWRWVFLFNVPLGIVACLWSALALKEIGSRDTVKSFDILGSSFFLVGIVALLVVLSFGGIYGWVSALTISLIVIVFVAFVAFIGVEYKTTDPLLELKLFSNRIFAMGNLSVLFNAMARMAVTFLLTFYFQGAKGYNALTAGILLTPLAATMFVTAPLSGWLSDRYDSRWLSAMGLFVTCVGLAGLSAIKLDTPYWMMILWMGLIGGGSGMFNSPNTSSIMGVVAPQKRGVAAGTRGLFMNIGMMVSMAMALDLVTNSMSKDTMMKIFTDQKVTGGSIALGGFIHGLHNAFLVSVGLSFIAALISLMRGKNVQQSSMVEAPVEV